MLARAIICLLALACLLAGVEAKQSTVEVPDIKLGELKNTMEIIGAENVSVTVGYPFSGMLINSSQIDINPGKKYVLLLIECEV